MRIVESISTVITAYHAGFSFWTNITMKSFVVEHLDVDLSVGEIEDYLKCCDIWCTIN